MKIAMTSQCDLSSLDALTSQLTKNRAYFPGEGEIDPVSLEAAPLRYPEKISNVTDAAITTGTTMKNGTERP